METKKLVLLKQELTETIATLSGLPSGEWAAGGFSFLLWGEGVTRGCRHVQDRESEVVEDVRPTR